MSSTIAFTLQKAFNKVLPIPKTPRVYRGPLPPKPLTWVPHGSIGNFEYELRLESFAQEILAINNQRTHPIKLSSRGWCYVLEGLGKIHKGEFDASQKAINDCRKIGLLPIDFVAQDQDVTRQFKGIHIAAHPRAKLGDLRKEIKDFLNVLPSVTTDYSIDEEYYVMMCVEKGDLLNLFKPLCDQYHVPIVSSKGWYPILLRADIATLSKRAEENGLTPVLLLFYDHDPVGLKISGRFRKNLRDCERGTGWSPDEVIIERFGLNKEDIDKYGLMWIENLKSSSGKDPDWRRRDVREYVAVHGKRKCEGNALFKNDETLRVAETLCRNAIEKYYGTAAIERFQKKEESMKEKFKEIYEDSLWGDFDDNLDELIESLPETEAENNLESEKSEPKIYKAPEVLEVALDNEYCGRCPKCRKQFNYSSTDIGKTMRCRQCGKFLKLIAGENWKK